MEFSPIVKKRFVEAGWKQGRNVFDLYKKCLNIDSFPVSLKNFLAEYGDLIVHDSKLYDSDVTNLLKIIPGYGGFEEQEDELYYKDLLGLVLYPFAMFEPDGYRVACDANGKIYLLGDYTFLIADTLGTGIEILVKDDWSKGYLQFDEKTRKWIKNKSWEQ